MAISETKVKTPWKHKAKAIFLGIVGFGAGFGTGGTSLILLNNDFSEIPKDPTRSSDSGILLGAIVDDAFKQGTLVTTVELSTAKRSEEAGYFLRVSSTDNTSRTIQDMPLAKNQTVVNLGKNPYQEDLVIEAIGISGKTIAERKFDLDTLLSDFKPNPNKPVMIFLYDYHRDEKFVTVLNGYAANQRTIIEDLQKHYGSNLLMIPEPNKHKLQALSKKINARLPKKSAVHVFISAHHTNMDESQNTQKLNIFHDYYTFGEHHLSDEHLNHFLKSLNTDPAKMIVIHNACTVEAKNFTRGTHIVTAPPDNWSISLPNFSGKLTCVAQEMIPLLARNASIDEICDSLEKNGTAKFQLLCNKVFKKIPQKTSLNLDTPSRLGFIVDRNESAKQR